MRSLLLIVTFLSACAAPSAHGPGFRQAAARPAPYQPPPAYTPGYAPGTPAEPVYTPQGAGAYRGDPLPSAPAPRSPNKRVLPREKDGAPGLWAADGDPALSSGSKPPFNPLPLFRTALVYSLEEARVDVLVNKCVAGLSDAANATGRIGAILALPEDVRKCMAARAIAFCVDTARNEFIEAKWSYDRNLPGELIRAADGAVTSAAQAVEKYCNKTVLGDKSRERMEGNADAFDDVTAQWKRVEGARQPNQFLR